MQQDWTYPSGFSPNGPYIDRLAYVVYPYEDQEIALLSLQAGSIDAYDSAISNNSVYELSFNPDVDINSELGDAYRQFTLNCQVFPTNITGYRRALAYTLDKFRVVQKSTGGFGEPQDAAIPLSNPLFACEQEMHEHFYYFEPDKANNSLQAAHFIDTPDSPHPGWRYYDADMSGNWTLGDKRGDINAPDGVKVEVIVSAGYWPAIEAGFELVNAMHACGLQAELVELDFSSFFFDWTFWFTSGNIVCFSLSVPFHEEADLLYDFFHSDGTENDFFSLYNNPEYDYNVTMLLHASTYLEARDWAVNCCHILLEDMPMIVCYNEMINHAYRIDVWEGFVDMVGVNRFGNNPWTLRKVHIKEELGGPWPPSSAPYIDTVEYYYGLTDGLLSTNILYHYDNEAIQRVMSQIYSRLWQLDPNTWEPVPDLAKNWMIEHTNASGDIREGQKFTFQLFENVTWHDGTPFTSADVAYNFETIYPRIWSSKDDLVGVYRVETPSNHTVEIYTNQTDFFEFSQITYYHILPEHIWSPYESLNFSWTPETPMDLTGTGPFEWVTRVPGQYILVDRYPDYHFGVERTHEYRPDNSWIITLLFSIIGITIITIQIIILAYLLKRRGRLRATKKGL
ncbi:MAG: ABC transporter substrate-binding protein [Candidatus Thorarchaeota archaeon]